VQLAALRAARQHLVAEDRVVREIDDGLVDAADLLVGQHAVELVDEPRVASAALVLNALHGVLDGLQEGSPEAHLGRLRER
jgi:hypothetical protein